MRKSLILFVTLLVALSRSVMWGSTIPVTDSNFLRGLTLNDWVVKADSVNSAVCGASFTLGFKGTQNVALQVDNVHLAGVAAPRYPIIAWTVNGGPLQTHQLAAGETSVTLAVGVANPVIDFYIKGMSPFEDRYHDDVPVNSVKITGFTIDDGGSTFPVVLPAKIWLNIGDSILSGDEALNSAGQGRPSDDDWAASDDARASYGYLLARHYGYREVRLAYGGYDWRGGLARVPALSTLIDQKTSTITRLNGGKLAPMPDVVLINLGENGAPALSDVTNALVKLRSRVNPATKIIVMIPLSGVALAQVSEGFNSYKNSSADTNAFLVNLGPLVYATGDGQHPTAQGHQTVYHAALPYFDAIIAPQSAAASRAVGDSVFRRGAKSGPLIVNDPDHKLVTLSDGDGQLTLRINYNSGCRLDELKVRGRAVLANSGAFTGIRISDKWINSKDAPDAKVKVAGNTLTVNGIHFDEAGKGIQETWTFTTLPDRILWKIARHYPADQIVVDMAFPVWNFKNMSAWTGGMLDNGGVVWDKYLDQPNATYGGHFKTVTFWNAQSDDCLRITPKFDAALRGAGRFSRQPDGQFSFFYTVGAEQCEPKYGQRRFLRDKQDLWKPLRVPASEAVAEFSLQAFEYDKAYDCGEFVGLDEHNVRELLNTVARYGVIDSQLVGGNGWRSGYICLHEPFFAQIAAALDSSDYTANLAAFLDNARDHAIEASGRVKSRWCYGPGDAMPGSYDQFGFYEAQWGYLMDSQPDYVMNVVELFNLTGDRAWLAGHKESCERALDFLTRREVAGSGLVAMMTDSHTQNRGSDWIDIIWASYENAFVNAQLYAALNLWAGAEEALSDTNRAVACRDFAARLKATFNKPTDEGGFWDPTNQWYVYWRDKDGSIHGNNLVTPVNFAAIAYGLCDDPARRKAILDRMESEMKKENLFYWPLSFFPYESDEGARSNFPFPKYENGDIFLSWGELGVRSYAAYNPSLALKYVRNTLDRYARDGLSFQRYLRASQQGAGDDILAGNCMPIVGLYRDIYGIQPKPNRLYLDPHLDGALSGTRLHYKLRGISYEINLSTSGCAITTGNCTIQSAFPFGLNASPEGVEYFPAANESFAMSVSAPKTSSLAVQIEHWPQGTGEAKEWTESLAQKHGKVSHVIRGLKPNAAYRLYVDGKEVKSFHADAEGQITFERRMIPGKMQRLKIALGI